MNFEGISKYLTETLLLLDLTGENWYMIKVLINLLPLSQLILFIFKTLNTKNKKWNFIILKF